MSSGCDPYGEGEFIESRGNAAVVDGDFRRGSDPAHPHSLRPPTCSERSGEPTPPPVTGTTRRTGPAPQGWSRGKVVDDGLE